MKDVKKAIKSMSPSIIEPFLTTASIVNAKATKIGNEQKADYVSDILNYQYQNEFDRLEFITSISTILPKEGTVFIRTGWAYEEKQEVKTLSKLDMDDIDTMKKQGVRYI
jgi:hypothetical protein